MTIDELHESVLAWLMPQLSPGRPFVLGVNGPQGGGKTTLTAALCRKLATLGKRVVTVSVDDFYLTRAEQLALAARFPRNPFLQQRGYPGTHDVPLGTRVISALRASGAGSVRVPRYEKSLHRGQGDRLPESQWSDARTPLDLVFFEGWMLGFTPVAPASAEESLRVVNEALAAYGAWNALLDGFLQLDPLDHRYVLDWRVEAEERMKAEGKPGMGAEEIRAYVEKFLPAYEIYLPGLRSNPPTAGPVRRIRIGRNRLPSS